MEVRGGGGAAAGGFLWSAALTVQTLSRVVAAKPTHLTALRPLLLLLQIRSMGLDDPSEQHRYADIATPGGFLRAVREVVATDVAAEPGLRAYVRTQLSRWVVVVCFLGGEVRNSEEGPLGVRSCAVQ